MGRVRVEPREWRLHKGVVVSQRAVATLGSGMRVHWKLLGGKGHVLLLLLLLLLLEVVTLRAGLLLLRRRRRGRRCCCNSLRLLQVVQVLVA